MLCGISKRPQILLFIMHELMMFSTPRDLLNSDVQNAFISLFTRISKPDISKFSCCAVKIFYCSKDSFVCQGVDQKKPFSTKSHISAVALLDIGW